MKAGGLFSLDSRDLFKGFIMSVLSAILAGVYGFIEKGALPSSFVDFKPILIAGIGAGITYILKNFLTNDNDKFLKKNEYNQPV